MKKIICIILSFLLILSISVTAFAAESSTLEAQININNLTTDFNDYLNGNMRSTSIPTKFYDLSKSDYNASLVEVRVSWLYTNYYFYSNSSGNLKVTYTIYSDTGRPTQMSVGLYDLDDKRMETTWTSSGSTLSGITESFYFINLDTTHRYAVAFTAVYDGFSYDSIHGSAIIEH